MVDVAKLVFEFDATSAAAAEQKIASLEQASGRLDRAAARTKQAFSGGAFEQARSSAGAYEKSLHSLIGVYGTAFNSQGAYTHSVAANTAMMLRNSQAQAALAKEADQTARAVQRLTSAYDPLAGEVMKLNAQLKENQRLFAQGRITAEQYEATAGGLTQKLNLMGAAHASGVKSTKALQYAQLNLGQQALDLGQGFAAAAASGEPLKMVMMTLMQQGPQLVGIFAEMKTGGMSAAAAMSGLWAAIAPIAVPLLAIGAAAATAFAIFESEIDKNTKHATTWGDTWNATIKVIGKNIMDGPIGDGLKWLGGAFAATLDWIVDGVMSWNDRTTGLFIAGYQTIVKHWKNLPQAFGAIITGAANNMIGGIEYIINGVVTGVNYLRKKAGMSEFGKVDLPEFRQANNAAAKDFEKLWTEATNSVRKTREGFAADIAKQADKEWEARQKSKKGAKEAADEIRQLAGLKPFDEDKLLKAAEEVWPYMAGVIQATEKRTRDLNAAAQQLDRTLGDIRIPSDLENLAYEMDEAARAARDLTFDIQDIAFALNENDWVSGLAGLVNVLAKVDTAFKNAKTSQDKFVAVAQLAQGVGSAVGGTGGAVVGGAGAGALAGLSAASALTTLGVVSGPVGWAALGIGAVVGGLGGLLGGSSAKKKAKREAEARRLAEEQQRQDQIAGYTSQIEIDTLRATGTPAGEAAAVAKEREAELAALAKLSPALVELKKNFYAVSDAADAAAEAAENAAQVEARRSSIQDEIDKLTLSSAALLAKSRAAERAEAMTLDPALGLLIDRLFGLQDAAAAAAEAAKAAEEAATAQAKAQEDALNVARENLRISNYLSEQAATKAAAAQSQLTDVMSGLGAASAKVSDALQDTMRSLTDFADSLRAELGIGPSGALDQAEKAFKAAVAAGNYAAIPQLGQAYASAAKESSSEVEYRRIIAQIRQASLNSVTSAKSDAYQRELTLEMMGAFFTSNWDKVSDIQRRRAAGLPGFANGGAFTIGGNPGVDQNLLSINGQGVARVGMGEVVSVQPRGASNDNSYGELVAEVRALRQQVADLQGSSRQTAKAVTRLDQNVDEVTEGGNAARTVPA